MARYDNELHFLRGTKQRAEERNLTHADMFPTRGCLRRNPVKVISLCVVQRIYLHYPVSDNTLTKQISCVNEI